MPDQSQTPLRRFLATPASLALILCIPVIDFFYQASQWPWSKDTFHAINHSTGELAARLLIATLVATPLRMLFPKSPIVRWLRRRRRILGIFVFIFALLHFMTYVLTRDFSDMAANLLSPKYIAGWVALLIFAALAATSFDGAVRKLGKRWKKLHKFTHLAAIAVALHWVLMSNSLPVYLHVLPVLLLQTYRIVKLRQKKAKRAVKS